MPTPTAVILPFVTVATDVSEDVHLTVLLVASVGLMVAVAVVLLPTRRLALSLESVIDSTGTVTFTVTVAVLPLFDVAVTVAVPPPTAVILPLSTVAIVGSEVVHVTVLFVAFVGATVAVTVVLHIVTWFQL